MPGDDVPVGEGTAKDIEGAADREVDTAATKFLDPFQVGEMAGAARVGGRNRRMLAEKGDELFLDASLVAFDIDAVDQKLIALAAKLGQGLGADADIGKGLPAIGDNPVAAVSLAAAEIQDQPLAANAANEGV